MPTIELETQINSTIEISFDLARSIDLHQDSTAQTKEKAIAGKTSGLIELGESVTWEATHLGFRQKLTTKITRYDKPYLFTDEQVKGIFKSLVHDHLFESKDGQVIMKDIFKYQSPLGIAGMLIDKLFLKNYMTQFLIKRNLMIKEYAETDKWKSIIIDR